MSRLRIANSYATRFLVYLVIVAVLGQTTIAVTQFIQRTWTDRLPVDHYFEYESVTFDSVDNDGNLQMLSLSAWHQTVDRVVWQDVLLCGPTPDQLTFFSSQEFPRSNFGPDPLNVAPWPYTSPWPNDGRTCVMDSTITIEHNEAVKSLNIQSLPFVPAPTS